ncbi:MAG: VWA domain-containing protein [Candidatus Omnitrophica bacterium]|nr:VWA domain-containing protein [Candidatus Omnitrophota bacterium]
MHWNNPEILNLLWLIPLWIILQRFWESRRKRALEYFAEARLLDSLAANLSLQRRKIRRVLEVAVLLLLILSLARPQIGAKQVQLTQKGIDILVALDVSSSMSAQDVAPSRLDLAKTLVQDFVSKLQGDRVGLILFAGKSYLQCPLTVDYSAFDLLLRVADPGMVPYPGTDVEAAISTAVEAFPNRPDSQKILLVLTDGESHHGDPVPAAEEASKKGVRIYTIGIGGGMPEGEPIPLRDENGNVTGHKRDANGKIIFSKLDEKTLTSIADVTGGSYFRATGEAAGLEAILKELKGASRAELGDVVRLQYEERYPWLAALVFILLCADLAIGDRKNAS